jgi:hypothetical protein
MVYNPSTPETHDEVPAMSVGSSKSTVKTLMIEVMKNDINYIIEQRNVHRQNIRNLEYGARLRLMQDQEIGILSMEIDSERWKK